MSSSIGVIGGADGPTAVFTTGGLSPALVVGCGILVIVAIVVFGEIAFQKRKIKRMGQPSFLFAMNTWRYFARNKPFENFPNTILALESMKIIPLEKSGKEFFPCRFFHRRQFDFLACLYLSMEIFFQFFQILVVNFCQCPVINNGCG